MLIEWVAAVLILGADGSVDRKEVRAPDLLACEQAREAEWHRASDKRPAPGGGVLLGGCHQDLPAGQESWIMRP